jgi:hypothetical protein
VKTTLKPRFHDIPHFMRETGLTLPATEEWRLTPCVLGEIHGLPTTHGVLLATNGILCYIELVNPINGLTYFIGHLDFFEPMDISYEDEIKSMLAKESSKPKVKKADLLALALLAD